MTETLSEADLIAALAAWELAAPLRITPMEGGFTGHVWLIETPAERLVAKYSYTLRADFDGGLRAAAALVRGGMPSSAPLLARDGAPSVMVPGPHGRSEPLALLQFVPGEPLDWAAPDAPALVGEQLGRVHRIWHAAPELAGTPDQIFAFVGERRPEVAAQPGLQELLDQTLANVRAFEAATPVTYGVTVGDFMEFLRDPATGAVGLIDTGTVGWGPLLFDVAIALHQFARDGNGAEEGKTFLQAYAAAAPIHPAELAGVRHYEALHWAQLTKYFAWRVAHNVTMGDRTPGANERSLRELRDALEALL